MKGTYFYYALGEGLARALPKPVMLSLIQGCTRLYLGTSPQDLRTVTENLRQALPAGSEEELRKLARRVILDFSAYLVDFVYTDRLSKDYIEKNIEKKGLENLDRALSGGRGVILASAHLGNWEMGGMALAKMGYPVHGVALRHKDERINRIFERRRGQHGLRIIPFNKSLRSCYRVLGKKEILGLVSDRLFGDGGVPVRFMGREVRFPAGISRLSAATGACVVPTFFIRKGPDQYRLEVDKPLEPSGERDFIQSFAGRLEKMIRQYPTQWFVFQPFWEAPEWPI
ncbi:MAG: lysophospholipid acyltransferase family protein [Candidatus Omnitrophota bacterium]